jgi:Fe-S-cluster containining protein
VLLDPTGRAKSIKKIIKEFPYKHTDGVCEKLIDNKCSVYESRPDLCNVDRFRERVFPGIDIGTWYHLVEESCRDLMRKSGQTEKEIDEIYEDRSCNEST